MAGTGGLANPGTIALLLMVAALVLGGTGVMSATGGLILFGLGIAIGVAGMRQERGY